MRNIKMILEYDGTSFYGFQRQSQKRTVQKVLEDALCKLFRKAHKIKAASGRTDSGVHARGQVVNFFTDSTIPPKNILKGLNRYLPAGIAVTGIREIDKNFHARFHAKSKTYEYLIWNHPIRSPLYEKRAWHFPYSLNMNQMKTAAKDLKGRHDFRSFCASGSRSLKQDSKRGTVRTVKKIHIQKEGALIRFRIEADGFLYHMVRNIVGTLTEVGTGKLTGSDIRAILKARDRKSAGRTAPSCGLYLHSVSY